MKRIYNKDSRLESHPLFPYIAWGTIIVFAVFVVNLTLSVENRISALEDRTTQLQYQYQYGVAADTAQPAVSE